MTVVYFVFSIVTSPVLYQKVLDRLDLSMDDDNTEAPRPQDPHLESVRLAHSAVFTWISGCMGFHAASEIPEDIIQTASLSGEGSTASSDDVSLKQGQRDRFFHAESALIITSKAISQQRLSLRTKADLAYRFWEVTSIVSIGLGMLTTIIVSLSTTVFGRAEGPLGLTLRVLAVVFPALGTAVAATIAFYGPQAEFSQASRSLASLTQLHEQMATGVYDLKCIESDGDEAAKDAAKHADDWAKRYVDILTVAAPSATSGPGGVAQTGQQTGGNSGGQSPEPVPPSRGPPK
ncbi:MAG: hypothetical protein JO038_05645 [Alphaproteobacteria bacterium]|nr:hypothetical protein [Alphaproteobacteria bacterium]